MKKLPTIPINRAVLEWDSITKNVNVVFHNPDKSSGMEYATGACNSWFRTAARDSQFFELLRAAFIACQRDGVLFDDIHKALSDIIEYSELIGDYARTRRKKNA